METGIVSAWNNFIIRPGWGKAISGFAIHEHWNRHAHSRKRLNRRDQRDFARAFFHCVRRGGTKAVAMERDFSGSGVGIVVHIVNTQKSCALFALV